MLQTMRTPTTIEAPTITTIPNLAIPDAIVDQKDPYVLLAVLVRESLSSSTVAILDIYSLHVPLPAVDVLDEGVGVGTAGVGVVVDELVDAAPARPAPAGGGLLRETIADVKTPGPVDSTTAPDFKWQFLFRV